MGETWRDEHLRWVCAFANAEGGVLEIGRNNRGVAVGVPNAARLLEELPNKVRDILGILVAVNLHEVAGLETLAVVVQPYPGGGGEGLVARGQRLVSHRPDRGLRTPVETPVKARVETPVEACETIAIRTARRPALSLARLAMPIGKSAGAVEHASDGSVSTDLAGYPDQSCFDACTVIIWSA